MRAALLALALLAASPAAAEAAPRYAAPGAMGTTCTVDDKGAIETAGSGAAADGEVIVTSGDYGSAEAPLSTSITGTVAGLDVHGEDGKPRPRIFTRAHSGLDVRGAGSHVRDLEIDLVSTDEKKLGLNFS